jgi:hypothetical protein
VSGFFFVPQIPALSSPAGRLGLIDHSESGARPRSARIIENTIPVRPEKRQQVNQQKKFDHKLAYPKLVKSLRRA